MEYTGIHQQSMLNHLFVKERSPLFMKAVYPVVLTPADRGFVVSVPDLSINTEGIDLADAIAMARDAIGIWGITAQDAGRALPAASSWDTISHEAGEIVTLIDIDFDVYRRENDA